MVKKVPDPWVQAEDLNDIKVNLAELRLLAIGLMKDGEKYIGLRDLLFHIRWMYRDQVK